ncbi:hypothetical protein [Phenylobacterium sp.]|uniref:hypothetical protein n=1 Tax=Phenylobacterium sp. TaxID=1871053 RepID=UPI002EDB29C1
MASAGRSSMGVVIARLSPNSDLTLSVGRLSALSRHRGDTQQLPPGNGDQPTPRLTEDLALVTSQTLLSAAVASSIDDLCSRGRAGASNGTRPRG